MARGMSRRGAFWLGALLGLVVSGGVAGYLLIAAPFAAEPAGMGDDQSAPAQISASPNETSVSTERVDAVEEAPKAEADNPAATVEAATESAAAAQKNATESDATEPGARDPEPAATEKIGAESPDDAMKAQSEPTEAPETPATMKQRGEAAAPADSAEAKETPEIGAATESADHQARPDDETHADDTQVDDTQAGDATEETAPGESDEAASRIETPAQSEPQPESTPAGAAEATGPRFTANAAAFDGDAARPLLAIVLTGAGAPGERDIERVMTLDKRITLVLAPNAAGPAALAARLRGAGFEVLAGPGRGAGAPALPGPVLGAAFVNAPDDAAAMVDALAAEGAALLDMSAIGGGALYREAETQGLGAAAAGARIDEVANSEMVYQALEQAAEQAKGAGALVAVGALTPATLSGVRRWMGVKAGLSAEVAPLSAVIRKLDRR